MRLAELEYPLPDDLIAQEPPAERSAARLLVLPRDGGALRHARIADLPALLDPGDLLVLNDTRVVPARVRGRRPSGGRLEVLFAHPSASAEEWEVLVRGSPRTGERVHFPDALGEWGASLGEGRWRLRLVLAEPILVWLERVGEVPLPPYVRRPAGPTRDDRERYQTVYARAPGAVAAPTAGLHFTPELLRAVREAGAGIVACTLHVGPGTFLPVRCDHLDDHVMAPEPYDLPPPAVEAIGTARANGGRVIAVGTTTVRALESAAARLALEPGRGQATLFIRPGHRFRVVDGMMTNFHLPRSTLLALVVAFAGWERVRAAYEEAIRRRYRFYSFGDAMLIT